MNSLRAELRDLRIRIRHHCLIWWSKRIFSIKALPGVEVLGSVYGGWPVPLPRLNECSVCYLAGVGEDVTFDLELIGRVGCDVHAFDPTPRAVAHAGRVACSESRFKFHPVGIWSCDTSLRFYSPSNPLHVSHSIVNLRMTDGYFEAPCRSIASLMEELGHDHVDLLKIDIEGAEYEVIESLFASGIFPTILCVEFDQPYPYRRTTRFIRMMLSVYDIYYITHWNFAFIYRAG